MNDTIVFNAVEQIEDKDLTIANLRAALQEQQAGFTNYQNTQAAKYAQLEQAFNNASQLLSTKPAVTPLDDAILSLVTTRITDRLNESDDIAKLIEQVIDQQVERIITKDDFAEEQVKECLSEMKIDCEDRVQEAVDEAIKEYLDQVNVDCEEVVQTAIEESLDTIEIKFGRRY